MSRFEPALYERALRALGKPPPPATALEAVDELEATLEAASALCRRWEGFYSAPYLCPAGVPTIGYGATHYLNGRRVSLRDPSISRETGERMLRRMLADTYYPQMILLCPGIAGEPPRRKAALLDFTFNLGAGNLRASHLRRVVNERRWDAAAVELRKWVMAKGVVLRGLVARRESEVALLLGT